MGADAIKFIYDDMARPDRGALPKMRPEVMRAIIDESHRQGLKAYVHALDLERAKEVLRAGADGLVHAVRSAVVDDEFLELMRARGAVYITTQALNQALFDPSGWARRLEAIDDRRTIPAAVYQRFAQMAPPIPDAARAAIIDRLRANVKKVHDAGVLVVAGTDTTVTGVLIGVSSQAELMLLVEDGLTARQALQAATINAARMLGREGLQGTVSAGKLADLVILDADVLLVRVLAHAQSTPAADPVSGIEGTVDGDTVSGTYKFAGDSGELRFTRQAPQPPGKRTPEQFEASYQAHKSDFD
jgi:imidazolonepropionase-like amidohydrolase